jgi:Holliday junction resolvasome RuvABC endonuclease subunit
MYQIAIDPGLTGTGYAVFIDGRVHETGTIYPKGDTMTSRLGTLRRVLSEVYGRLVAERGERPSEITIEEWHRHYDRVKFHSMVKCAEARGIILGVSLEYCEHVRYLSKGSTGKQEAELLAKICKIDGSEHAKDALHLGILAGYYKVMR